MATIDLAQLSVTEANRRLLEHGEAGEDVEIVNPDARHHIGVGLTSPITVRVRGSAGYFCAGLTDGPRFEVDANVGWGLADNMLQGSVVVHGNAGAIAGDELAVEDGRLHRQVPQQVGDVSNARREVVAVAGEDGDVLAGLCAWMRYPSNFTFCSQSLPDGTALASIGLQGWMNWNAGTAEM